MKNRLFEIEIDPKTGCMAALYDPGDAYRMNWCAGEGAWGRIDCRRFADYPARALFEDVPMALKAFEQDEAHCRAEYAGGTLCALVERFFAENGNLRERVTATNTSDVPVVLDADNFGVEFPFPDSYTYAAECLRTHCHTHIWCGGEGAWINAVRMGPFGKSLGLALVRGAFLIYDNTTERTYFDNLNSDHNACRERLNMAFVLAKYLQQRSDPALRAALDRFVDFVFREIYDEKTGEVFNTIRKNRNALRLYNAPGVMFLFCETYFVTHEKRLLECAVRLAETYYSIGGEKCYSNAVEIRRILSAFDDAGMPAERAKMRAYFKRHADTMVKNGLDYPKHEVNYEQTIVTPAVKCIAEMGEDSEGEERAHYLAEAKKHLACLERFCGMQPSFHLYGISVRYWDDFWFGKQRLFGDTLPHHLSCLTARAYYAYARLSGEEIWRLRADEIIRNCLCLIDDDGRGHAAYVYPYRLNEARGELYDEWANDQDLPLYDGCAVSSSLRALQPDGSAVSSSLRALQPDSSALGGASSLDV